MNGGTTSRAARRQLRRLHTVPLLLPSPNFRNIAVLYFFFQTRLNGLTMLAVHKEVSLTADEVINELAKKPRKLNFVL